MRVVERAWYDILGGVLNLAFGSLLYARCRDVKRMSHDISPDGLIGSRGSHLELGDWRRYSVSMQIQ